MKYLVAFLFIGGISAAILTVWLGTRGRVMWGVERDRCRARWKVVNRPGTEITTPSVWIALTGPSGFEFDHKQVGTYDIGDLQREMLLHQEAESSAEFLNKRLTPTGRHSRRRTTQGES